MNKQELIDYCNDLKESKNRFINCIDVDGIIDTIKQLDEPQKVVVPQFVADWIEESKKSCETVVEFLGYKFSNIEMIKYLQNKERINLVARAWLDGYEVEKESKYIVKVKATGQCLGKYYINNEILSPRFIYTGRHADSFTRKELEEADFSWVFDCDGVGVEEVE